MSMCLLDFDVMFGQLEDLLKNAEDFAEAYAQDHYARNPYYQGVGDTWKEVVKELKSILGK